MRCRLPLVCVLLLAWAQPQSSESIGERMAKERAKLAGHKPAAAKTGGNRGIFDAIEADDIEVRVCCPGLL